MDKAKIEKIIEEYTEAYPHSNDTGWEKPLVAYARADDPLFGQLKELASPIHEKPTDFLKEAKTVITYFIPFKEQVVKSNLRGRYCSKTWALSYIETNKLIAALNQKLQELLIKEGYRAVYVPATQCCLYCRAWHFWGESYADYQGWLLWADRQLGHRS
jgi:epoxyqueuosine reductase QueG